MNKIPVGRGRPRLETSSLATEDRSIDLGLWRQKDTDSSSSSAILQLDGPGQVMSPL